GSRGRSRAGGPHAPSYAQVRHSPDATACAAGEGDLMTGTVVWATDGSAEAERALDVALRLEPARLVAVHCRRRGATPQVEQIAHRLGALQQEGRRVELVVRDVDDDDDDAISVAAVASEIGAQMIVCGSSGHRAPDVMHLAP